MTRRRRAAVVIGVTAGLALVPAFAFAHVERASYWPDPAADNSVTPPAGGAVPSIPSLGSVLNSQPGTTRVVCQTGQPGPTSAPTQRPDVDVSKAEVDRLTAQLTQVQAAISKAKKKHKKHKKHKKKKLRRLRRQAAAIQAQLTQAQQAYQAALTAEQNARTQGGQSQQQALAAYQNSSMGRLDADIANARANGVSYRPSQPAINFSQQDADQLRAINVQLNSMCQYSSIQAAVTASGNNDRVVVMPGVYTEPASRAAPTHDPACNPQYNETNDKGDTGAVSYQYQFHCPNDQNLIAVIGRQPGPAPPQPPATDRHGIPDNGPCIRCNLTIRGSGPSPDDAIVEGADPSLGDHSPAGADQSHYPKDVGIRADRADGFVLDNLKVRHVNEHAVYVTETDGFNLDHLKTDYNGEYGVLTFVADHSLIHNCDAWGNGDSGLYPGAAADTWDAVPAAQRRRDNEIRDCDMHHNALGYSGTDGNAVHVDNNEFYDNTQGFSTDVFTAPGHPGFPQDSDLIENNNFHDNNFNTYLPGCPAGVMPGPPAAGQSNTNSGGNCSDVTPTVPVPVGNGLWIAGGNHNIVQNNHFWDNWRRGTMLFTVPDSLVCGASGSITPADLAGCNPNGGTPGNPPSTSFNNQFHDNVMGRTPGGAQSPNGTDFWWDEGGPFMTAAAVTQTGDCWFSNVGKDNTAATVTSTPNAPGQTPPGLGLPSDCSNSPPTPGTYGQGAELVNCLGDITFDSGTCDWFVTPAKP
jgi:hypothetical protein